MGTRKSRSPWMMSSGCVDALDPGPVVLEELGDDGGLGDAEPLRHSTDVGRATFDDHAPDLFSGARGYLDGAVGAEGPAHHVD